MNLKRLQILFLFLSFSLPLKSQIIYVKPDATGNGTSWTNARGDLRQAIKSATFGTQVWVAKGTYFATTCSTCTDAERMKYFEPTEGVEVYGGFAGTETSLSQRNWEINKTILSGDIDGDGRASNNTFNIFYLRNISSATIIDGFTITGGNADNSAGSGELFASGGAMYVDGRSGGFSYPTVRNCNFTRNFAKGFGGAVFNNGGYSGSIEPHFLNCQFSNNYSLNGGGAVCNWGVFNGTGNPIFESCQFIGNKTENSGGAVLSDAQMGLSEAKYINCQFYKNEATLYGGAIYNLGKSGNCTPTISNSLFWSNKAFSAAGVYCLGSINGNSSPRITNCVFYKNEAHTGGSVYANAGENDTTGQATGTAKPLITNCIIWGNIAETAPILRNINGTPTISHSIVEANNCAGIHSGVGPGVTCGEGMVFNQNPLFVDADNGDFHLQPNSPAINLGLNSAISAQNITIDLDSLPRIVNNTVDIGVFEFNPAVQYPPHVLISPESQTVCSEQRIVLRTQATGSQPLFFQWYKNNEIIPNATSDSLIFSSISQVDSGTYKCIVRNELNKTANTSDAILKVKPMLPLSISINLVRTPNCEGDTVAFKAEIKNGGNNPKIEWLMNGSALGKNTADFSAAIMNSLSRYSCKVTSTELCSSPTEATSNEILVPVETNEIPSISISASTLSGCVGDNISFNTTIKNGGDTPQYEWYINNVLTDNRANTFESTQLKDGDKVKTILKSSKKCIAQNTTPSNEVVVALKNRALVGVVMNANHTEICAGDSVTFTAIGTGGGSSPQYEWYINATKQAEKSPILKVNNLKNGDKVKSVFISSEICPLKNPVESAEVAMTVNDNTVPTIDIHLSKSIICKGERVVFEALGKNIGLTPQYQWFRNGKLLNWDNAAYTTDSLRFNDSISVVVQSSNQCVIERTIISKISTPTVRYCLYTQVYGDKQALVYPNPSSYPELIVGLVNLTGEATIDIFTQEGQILVSKKIENIQSDKEVNFDLPNLIDGMYLVRVINGDFVMYKKWILSK